MTENQKITKYLALGLAALLIIGIFGSIISLVGWLVGGSGVYDEIKTYEVSGSVTKLDIEVNAADLEIVESDKFYVESNLKSIRVKDSDGTLKITENGRYKNYKDPVLKVYIPSGTVFDEAEISTGAGRFSADAVCAKELKLEQGAGEIVINELRVTRETEIESGAGKLTVRGGSVCGLEFDMGVGEINFEASIVGEAEINCGVGEANITLIGTEADYRVVFARGIGEATFNGVSVKNGDTYGNGANKVEINCGIGAVNLEIKE